MASILFPFNNKCALKGAYRTAIEDNLVRTEFDTGTHEVRPRRTRVNRTVECKYRLQSQVEVDQAYSFYESATKQGALAFEWSNIDGKRYIVRMIKPISIEHINMKGFYLAYLTITVRLLKDITHE